MVMWMELGKFSSDSGMVVMEEPFYGTVLNPDKAIMWLTFTLCINIIWHTFQAYSTRMLSSV
jgi:hypothetical protein